MQILKQREWREYCIRALKANNVAFETTPGGAFKFITGRTHITVTDLCRLSPADMNALTGGRA
jgi:hypothetical protein